MKKTRLAKQYSLFVLGLIINSFGISFITKAALGTSPISSLPYVASLKFSPTLGQFTFLMNCLFILAQAILLGKAFPKIQYLQILVNIVFSGAIDVSMLLLQFMQPETMVQKTVSLVTGCAILALGITLEVAANVLLVPGEGVVKAIAQVLQRDFGTVKVCFDVTTVALAGLLSFSFFQGLRGIGIGTVVSAVLVGMIVKFYRRVLPIPVM
ncbi:YitT family protein [uncultured Ruthenibacterium sp.]|uniref:YczE/YyaS/YitT family protein n=1 Tax=uncultured Ruthenibacterium sp. TaxID=1905347 RepID=UPI00349E9FD0